MVEELFRKEKFIYHELWTLFSEESMEVKLYNINFLIVKYNLKLYE